MVPTEVATTVVSYASTPQDQEEAEAAIQSLSVNLGTPSASVQVGVEAVRSIMREIIAERRSRALQLYKHGRPINTAENEDGWTSMPLRVRQSRNKFPYHKPPRPTEEGDDLAVVFSLLLAVFEQKGFFDRMDAKPNSAAPDEFLTNHWVKFAEGCNPEWLQMSMPQKTMYLRSWLVKKLSMDVNGKQMLPVCPSKRKARNDMCWLRFEISDCELDTVLAEVMAAYQSR